MYTRCVQTLSHIFTGGFCGKLITDIEIVNFFIQTGACQNLEYDAAKKLYSCSFHYMDNYALHSGYYFDVREVTFTLKEPISIILREQTVIKSEASEEDWKLAKLHLQVMMTFYTPGMQHNWVHFVLPSTFAVNTPKVLQPNSVLRKLLTPHIRFTEIINHQALFIGNASDNNQSLADRYLKPWLAFPMNNEVFIENIARHCQIYYSKRPEVFCPSPFLHNESLTELPYVKQAQSYYTIIRKFVSRVAHQIDPQDWQYLAESINKSLPGIEDLPMVDVLSTFIWQVAVIHSMDHAAYYTFMRKYLNSSCISMSTPYKPYTNTKFWTEKASKMNVSIEEIKQHPEKYLLGQAELARTHTALDLWVTYIPSLFNDTASMRHTNYSFDHADLTNAHEVFMKDLENVNEELQSQTNESGEKIHLVELDGILQSIRH